MRNHVTVCSGRKSKATRCIKYAKELKGVKQVYGALYALGTTYQQVRLQVFEQLYCSHNSHAVITQHRVVKTINHSLSQTT